MPIPINDVIQNDMSLSTMVAAALMDGGTPAAENKIIITPSTAPTPPGSKGIIPIKVAITNTAAIIPRGTGVPNDEKTMYTLLKSNILMAYIDNDVLVRFILPN